MTSIKLKFRPSAVGCEGTLFYQVIHDRSIRQLRSGFRLPAAAWDNARSTIVPAASATTPSVPAASIPAQQQRLAAIRMQVAEELRKLRRIVAALESSGRRYTAGEVFDRYRRTASEGFFAFAERTARRLKAVGRVRTGETYTAAINSFRRFCGGGEIAPEELDADLMTAYESRLLAEGLCPNTTSFYMRNLRALYNRAAEEGLTPQRHPFRHVYTGIEKTEKRAVPLPVIRNIRQLALEPRTPLALARDLFLFSFYTRGMAFVDMAYLKKRDLRDGVLTYRRKKTGQRIAVKWEACMQEIVARYADAASPYLLPIIRRGGDERRQYLNAGHLVNGKLKQLGERLGLHAPLTMYVARHAWASIAKSRNIPVSVISEGLGHDSETTTRIYLASLSTANVDRANRIVLDALRI